MVATPVQSDFTTQSAAAYKAAIDASTAVHVRLAGAFAPHEQSTPNMTVRLEAGMVLNGTTLTEVAAQSTGTITAPATNPRIDRIVVNLTTGAVSVITGTPAGSPVAPALVAGVTPIARVLVQTSSTTITNSMITDERINLTVPQTSLAAQADLVSLMHVNVNTAHRDTLKAGYQPGWTPPAWMGGVHYWELVDAATGIAYKFESATGYFEQNATVSTGDISSRTGNGMGFKVSKTDSYPAIWVKMAKTGNPTNNLELRIQADSSGKPTANFTAITNGTATAIVGKQFGNGEAWVRFVFATPPTLTAGVQYHFTTKSSGAVDASNYWSTADRTTASTYPHGYLNQADATPTWTSYTPQGLSFLVESPTTTQTFQAGGVFGDGKAVFYAGSPIDQSNQRRANIKDIPSINMGSGTFYFIGTAQGKDTTLLDFFYGSTENRCTVRCDVTTGYASVTLRDSSGTSRVVTGTTDISSGDAAVGIKVIANTGSGTDKLELWVKGVSEGTPITGVAITIDELFRQGQVGSLWVGGGAPLAPTWTGSSILSGGFSGLPSTLGWTWAGSATESSYTFVSGGLHYFNKNGSAANDGYNTKTITANNATGTVLEAVVKMMSGTNTYASDTGYAMAIFDGTKHCSVALQEYFAIVTTGGSTYIVQFDFKSNFNTVQLQAKGNDMYLVVNGAVLFDGTNLNTTATASNLVAWGDFSAAGGETIEAITKSIKYYTGGLLMPVGGTGSFSEWALWTGDKTNILASLWNGGSPISVMKYCGVGPQWRRGDSGQLVTRQEKLPVTLSPTNSGTIAILQEMELFFIGTWAEFFASLSAYNDGINDITLLYLYFDGKSIVPTEGYMQHYNASTWITIVGSHFKRSYFGVHKIEVKWTVNAGTSYAAIQSRVLRVTSGVDE